VQRRQRFSSPSHCRTNKPCKVDIVAVIRSQMNTEGAAQETRKVLCYRLSSSTNTIDCIALNAILSSPVRPPMRAVASTLRAMTCRISRAGERCKCRFDLVLPFARGRNDKSREGIPATNREECHEEHTHERPRLCVCRHPVGAGPHAGGGAKTAAAQCRFHSRR
jgi:hypothetical protein